MTTTRRTTTAAAIVLSLAVVPSAIAKPTDFTPASHRSTTVVYSYSRPDRQMIPVSSPATYGVAAAAGGVAPPAGNQLSAPPAAVQVQTPQSGFDWGDAGIGAAGAVALLTLGLGGAFVIYQRRPRRSHDTALPS